MTEYAGLSPDLNRLIQGRPPESGELLRSLSVGLDSLTEFLGRHYLEDYIPQGGSKIKFVTGRPGSGKTHFARLLLAQAGEKGYLTVSFSAKEIWLHDFREVYLEILRQCDIERVLSGCAGQIVRELGYRPEDIPPDRSFLDYLLDRGEGDALSRGEIRSALRRYFTRNSLLDNCFAACCSLLTGGLLGHPALENASRELLLGYLHGDKTVKLSQLRALGLSPSGITRFNARHLLRSLAEVVRLAGYKGLLVLIDDMETLLVRAAASPIHYTKLRREDTYESIRQLIDDIDSMRYVLFLFCFDRELMDNENYGMKSYQALWLRIQNEIVSARFNRFADILDLDRYADEAYDSDTLCAMSRRLAEVLRSGGVEASPISPETAAGLAERAQFGGVGLPCLVNREVVEGGIEHG
ncbi:MAG: DUF2791 family P-loop domain-containing protein [Oscillospiraceae bacterium]|nr:DUF2791 family P-loop domain-containing protein [Oscillospiraceae bacterium]